MKLEGMMTALKFGAQKLGFKASKHAPEVLVIGGVVLGVAATVVAIKKSFDVKEDLDVYRDKMALLEDGPNDPEVYCLECGANLEEEVRKERRQLVLGMAIKMAKAYALPLSMCILAVIAILYGHGVRNQRYLAAAAAWAASQADYKALLERVREAYGEDEMMRLKYNLKDVMYDEVVEHEDGTRSEVVKGYAVAQNPPSLYARIFDESCAEWRKDPIHNMMWLRQREEAANQILQQRGFITLNEVYDALGFEQNAKYGNEAGWIKGHGDDFVSFGIYDDLETNPAKRAFVNGYERSILLDFNCIGRIREYA